MTIQDKLANRSQKESVRPLAVGLYPTMIEQIDKVAEKFQESRSEIVRILLEDSLSRLNSEEIGE